MWRIEYIRNMFMEDEEGVTVVEIILILVVLIGLVLIFKKQLVELVNKIFQKINTDSTGI